MSEFVQPKEITDYLLSLDFADTGDNWFEAYPKRSGLKFVFFMTRQDVYFLKSESSQMPAIFRDVLFKGIIIKSAKQLSDLFERCVYINPFLNNGLSCQPNKISCLLGHQ